jgi:hypothetical protein
MYCVASQRLAVTQTTLTGPTSGCGDNSLAQYRQPRWPIEKQQMHFSHGDCNDRFPLPEAAPSNFTLA